MILSTIFFKQTQKTHRDNAGVVWSFLCSRPPSKEESAVVMRYWGVKYHLSSFCFFVFLIIHASQQHHHNHCLIHGDTMLWTFWWQMQGHNCSFAHTSWKREGHRLSERWHERATAVLFIYLLKKNKITKTCDSRGTKVFYDKNEKYNFTQSERWKEAKEQKRQ